MKFNHIRLTPALACAAALIVYTHARADVKLPSMFTDHARAALVCDRRDRVERILLQPRRSIQ